MYSHPNLVIIECRTVSGIRYIGLGQRLVADRANALPMHREAAERMLKQLHGLWARIMEA